MVSPTGSPDARPYNDIHSYDGVKSVSEKKYCFRKLKKNQCIAVTVFAVLAGLLTVILLGIFVGGKAIAQSGVNSSQVGVSSMTLGAPVDGDKGLNVKIEGSISNGSPHDSTIAEFVMSMLYQDKKFAEIPYPEMQLAASAVSKFVVEGVLTVFDMDVFIQYSKDLLEKNNVTVTTTASVTAKAMGLTFSGLNLEKSLTLPGVRGFNNPPPKVIRQNIVQAKKDSITLGMDVSMYNPSSFIFTDTGKLTMSIQYEETLIGYAVTVGDSVTIPTGEFEIRMEATIMRNPENNDKVVDLLSKFTTGEDITMTLNGENTTIPLLSSSVKGLKTVTTINGLDTLSTERNPPYQFLEGSYYEMINPVNIASSFHARDIHSKPEMIQVVYCPMPQNIAAGLTLPMSNGKPAVTAYQVVYNPLNATVKIHFINITVFFHKDTSGRYPLSAKMPNDFILAEAHSSSKGDIPVISLKPMETALMPQILEISMNDVAKTMEFYQWIYEAYKLDEHTGLPRNFTHAKCLAKGYSAASCGGSFATSMHLVGEVEITVGDGFRTFVGINQYIRNDATLYDTSKINFTSITYLS